jgi:hypothetical protein
VLGQRVDQQQQVADLGQRGADVHRALRELVDRAARQQARFVARLRDLVLVFVERGDGAEERVCSARSRSEEAMTDWTRPDTSEQPTVTSLHASEMPSIAPLSGT